MEETTISLYPTHCDYMFCPVCGSVLLPSSFVFLEFENVVGCENCYNEYGEYERR